MESGQKNAGSGQGQTRHSLSSLEIGLQALAEGDQEKAKHFLSSAFAQEKHDPSLYAGLGLLHLRSNELDLAESFLEKCLTIEPLHHDGLLYRGGVKMARAQWADAINLFQKMIQIYPLSYMAYRTLGQSLASIKDFEKARVAFQTSVQLSPACADTKINTGITTFWAGHQQEALSILREVILENPRNIRARGALTEFNRIMSGRLVP